MGHKVKMRKSGRKIECNDPQYHYKRKVWNSHVDRYPSIIFECKTEADVMEAVKHAKEKGLKISVRSGGFHPAGLAVQDNAVLIDLSNMNDIQVDEVSKVATIDAGAKISEIDQITQEYGLAIPLGMVSTMGVSGLALGGGLGYLRGMYGLTSDNIVGVNIVTAAGDLQYVNRFNHAELFWAIRGAGTNFGVVTKFEFQLHPVGKTILALDVIYDYKDIYPILKKADQYRRTAIDELSFHFIISNGITAGSSIPKKGIRLIGMYAGDLNVQVEEEVIRPLQELAKPVLDNTEVMSYVDVQKKFDSFVREGLGIEGISLFFQELSEEALSILHKEFEKARIPITIHLLELHGQVNRISKYDSAFTIRDAGYLLIIEAEIRSHPHQTKQWINRIYKKLLPFSYNQASYLNSANNNDEVVQNSYKNIYSRLVALKKDYDPENLFCSTNNLL
ncbi:FAD-dependent oxidoreductase [Ornithinibacillus xuwenensis]|uniref:FAD-binding protein n=1 Tax=Ornithinibacillus xuwenensis TaxID=3144668 RepID=A0ABU9XJW1_9BACI